MWFIHESMATVGFWELGTPSEHKYKNLNQIHKPRFEDNYKKIEIMKVKKDVTQNHYYSTSFINETKQTMNNTKVKGTNLNL